MISSIYLLAIGLYPSWDRSFERQIKAYFSQQKGDGWEIKSCTIKHDPLVNKILYNLDYINDKEKESTFKAAYATLRLRIEASSDIRYQPLPWIEKLAREFILENSNPACAGYFFYFIENNDDIDLRIFASCNEDGTELTESDTDDDYTYIKRHTGFLFRHLMYNDAETYYPDIMANLLLQFGNRS